MGILYYIFPLLIIFYPALTGSKTPTDGSFLYEKNQKTEISFKEAVIGHTISNNRFC
jgi:hypothetical protein